MFQPKIWLSTHFFNVFFRTCPISTTVMGQAASMGSLLGCAGSAGKRYAMPNSRIMVHQPSGGAQGMASDIQIQAQEIQILKEQLSHMYVHHCGTSYEEVEAKLDRDTFMSAYEAKEFGLVDEVISHGTAHIAEKYGKRKQSKWVFSRHVMHCKNSNLMRKFTINKW